MLVYTYTFLRRMPCELYKSLLVCVCVQLPGGQAKHRKADSMPETLHMEDLTYENTPVQRSKSDSRRRAATHDGAPVTELSEGGASAEDIEKMRVGRNERLLAGK